MSGGRADTASVDHTGHFIAFPEMPHVAYDRVVETAPSPSIAPNPCSLLYHGEISAIG